jgi:hypothetical protein
MDPAEYLARDLVGLDVPAIVYRAVSRHTENGLRRWLGEQDPARALSVFVGASSREKAVATSLSRAYDLRTEVSRGSARDDHGIAVEGGVPPGVDRRVSSLPRGSLTRGGASESVARVPALTGRSASKE